MLEIFNSRYIRNRISRTPQLEKGSVEVLFVAYNALTTGIQNNKQNQHSHIYIHNIRHGNVSPVKSISENQLKN